MCLMVTFVRFLFGSLMSDASIKGLTDFSLPIGFSIGGAAFLGHAVGARDSSLLPFGQALTAEHSPRLIVR